MRLSGKNMSQTGQPFSHLRTKILIVHQRSSTQSSYVHSSMVTVNIELAVTILMLALKTYGYLKLIKNASV